MRKFEIVKQEIEYWKPLTESKNRLIKRVANVKLFEIRMKQHKFNRLTKSEDK